MAKIALTIKSTYLPSWGVYEGVRELVSNGRDAEVEHGALLEVTHTGKKLVIENMNVTLPYDALLLGHTTKTDKRDLIGTFGEGLKLGVLALVRAGCKVKIRTGSEVWTPSLEPSDKFSCDVLTFDIQGGREAKNRVRVEIEGISAEDWKTFKGFFLFLNGRSNDDQVVVDGAGTLLCQPRFEGRVYVKGVFVQHDKHLAYGYDLADAEVDRDRRLVHRWDLTTATRKIWEGALAQRPDLTDGFVKLLDANKMDVERMDSFYVDRLPTAAVDAVAAKFVERHGEGAVPVKDFGASKDVGHLGRKGVVVSEQLGAILALRLGTQEEIKAKLANEVTAQHAWTDLTPSEQGAFSEAEVAVRKATGWKGALEIVDFRSDQLHGLCELLSGRVQIARKTLAAGHFLRTLIHEVAHAETGAPDGDKLHVAAIEETWERIWRNRA